MTFRAAIWPLFFLVFANLAGADAQSLAPYRRLVIEKVGETKLGTINDLVEDGRGFIWLAGYYSVYRYDGAQIEAFSNRPDDTASIVPGPYEHLKKSRAGEGLWIGSSTGGLSYLDLQTGKALNYTANAEDQGALAGNSIADIYEDPDGGMWVGTDLFALHYLSPGSKRFLRFRPPLPAGVADYPAAGLLGEIIPDRHDPRVLWIGSRFGVYRFDRKNAQFQLFPFEHNLQYWYRPQNLQIYMDADGMIWCGGITTGLCKLNTSSGHWQVFKKTGQTLQSHNINNVLDIAPLDDTTLLTLTLMDDAWKVNLRTGAIEFLSISTINSAGIPVALFSMCRSFNGDLWLAYGNGLVHLTKKSSLWPFVSFPGLNPSLDQNNWQRAYLVSGDKKYLYIGTLRGNGLLKYRLDDGNTEAFSYRNLDNPGESDVLMDALCFGRDGRLWIGTDTGLLYLNRGERIIRSFDGNGAGATALQGAQVTSLYARNNELWVGTKGRGAFRVDLQTDAVEQLETRGLIKTSAVSRITGKDKGPVWFGHDRGLTAYDPARKTDWHFDRQKRPPSGLSDDQVTSLAYDAAGHLWVSTLGGGMMRLLNGDQEHPHFDAYYNNEVPGGNVVYEFAICDRGRIWLGTQSGLAVLDTAAQSFVNYDSRDGMIAKIGSMIRLPDGRIASAAYRGFHLFHPDSVLHSGVPPVPYLRNFRIFDRDVDLPYAVDRMEQLTLNYNQNHFSFELGALNFEEKARTHYAYRLEGYDQDWVFSGTRNYLSYNNLPAGEYVLRVKAANKSAIWSEHDKTIGIVIRPPYWQTWWFRLLVLAFVSAVAYGIYKAWRQRRRTLIAQRLVEYFAHADYSGAGVRDILWDVAHKCLARLRLEDCVIYLLDESGEYLVQAAAYGANNPGPYELQEPLRIPLGRGIVGAAGLKAQPELVPDTRRDPRYIVDDQPRLSELAIPIVHEGRLVGVIDSEHSRQGFFTEYHIQVLKTIASLCAGKIAQARARELMEEKERQLNELNRNLAESQLTALRAQMNPHFLFNCLNSINWYIIKNRPAEASRYIARFSKLIRLILEHSKKRQITLERELEALRLYLDMEAMRFEHRFDYQIEVPPDIDIEDIMVPPLIFQPYVENAIWHGLMPKNAPGRLQIHLKMEKNALVCIIEDNGIGREAAAAMRQGTANKRESQGLKITEARIRQMGGQSNGAPVRFTDLYDETGAAAGTRVEVRVG
ncbi:MAG: histidine kinase [Saprospiraceae bacterium]